MSYGASKKYILPQIRVMSVVEDLTERLPTMDSFWIIFPLLPLVIIWGIWKVFLFKGLRRLQQKSADE